MAAVGIRGHSGPHKRWGGAHYAVVVAKEDERGLLEVNPPRTHGGHKAAVFSEVELAVESWPDDAAVAALLDELPHHDRVVLTLRRGDLAHACIRDLRAAFEVA